MSQANPRTVAEWRQHVGGLEREELVKKAGLANSMGFVRQLQSGGYSAEEIHGVFSVIAGRLAELRAPFPQGLYDLERLSREGRAH